MEIFKLFGSIFIDNKEANKSIDKTSTLSGKLVKGLENAGKVAGGVAKGVGIASTAILGAGTAITGLAKKGAEASDHIDKMSQKLGLSREGFQEWDFILSQSGASLDSMQAGMTKLTKSVDSGSDAFAQIGLNVNDLKNMTQEDIFETTVKALQGVENEVERTALANELLGKSGAQLAPLLNSGADSIDNMKKQAQELGLVMGDETIDAGVQLTDTLDQLSRVAQVLLIPALSAVMPVVNDIARVVIDNMPTILSSVQEVFGYIMPVFEDLIKQLLPLLIDLFTFLATKVLPVVIEVFKYFSENILPILIKVITTVAETISDFVSNTIKLFQNWYKENKATIDKIIAVFEKVLVVYIKNLIKFWTGAFDMLITAVKGLATHVGIIIDTVVGILGGLIDFVTGVFTGDWDKAWSGIVQIFSAVTDGIHDVIVNIETMFGELIDKAIKWGSNLVSGFVDGIKSKASTATDGVQDLMSNVADFIGFNSPSKKGEGRNIVKWGANMVSGFADGIEKGIKYVVTPLENLMSEVATKIAKGSEEVYDNIVSSLEKSFSTLTSQYDKLGEGLMDALEEMYDEQEKKQVKALNKELSNQRKLTDSKIALYDKEYMAKIKLLDEEEARAISAITEQINAIDEQTEAEERLIEEKEYNEKLAKKYNELASASAEEKAGIQAEIDEMISEKQRKELLERREIEKENLRKQIDEIKNSYDKQREEEEKLHEDKVARLEKDYEALETANQKELEALAEHYENLRSQENLEAEARRLILTESNDEMIALLESYNPQWLNAGKSFGEKMLEGLLEIVPSIEQTVAGIMQTVSNATSFINGSSVSSTASKIGSYTVKAGDTLSAIAKKFNTTVSEIAKVNNIVDVNVINAGQELQIPNLAQGGTVLDAGRIRVGEAGAEILTLPKGAKVEPLDKAKSTEGQENINMFIENQYVQDGTDFAKKTDEELNNIKLRKLVKP